MIKDTGIPFGLKLGGGKMSKDISTAYTKERNKQCGRHGEVGWQSDKDREIIPADYGMFLQKQKKRGKR